MLILLIHIQSKCNFLTKIIETLIWMFFVLLITGGEITDLFDQTTHEEYESCLPEDSPSACDEKETLHDEELDKGLTAASKKLKGGI